MLKSWMSRLQLVCALSTMPVIGCTTCPVTDGSFADECRQPSCDGRCGHSHSPRHNGCERLPICSAPFFGHRPTCWHEWPADWMGCPPTYAPAVIEGVAPPDAADPAELPSPPSILSPDEQSGEPADDPSPSPSDAVPNLLPDEEMPAEEPGDDLPGLETPEEEPAQRTNQSLRPRKRTRAEARPQNQTSNERLAARFEPIESDADEEEELQDEPTTADDSPESNDVACGVSGTDLFAKISRAVCSELPSPTETMDADQGSEAPPTGPASEATHVIKKCVLVRWQDGHYTLIPKQPAAQSDYESAIEIVP